MVESPAAVVIWQNGLQAQPEDDCQVDLSERPQALIKRHPWEAARYHFFSHIMKTWQDLSIPRNVLDVGSGDGFFSQQLMHELAVGSRIVCWDSNYTETDIRMLARQSPNSIQYDVEVPNERFDLVLLLDVLEHVKEDVTFLKRIVDCHMVPGAISLISLPAWRALFSRHDLALKHYRRYSGRDGFRLVRKSGLELAASGGLFYSLLVPRIFAKILECLVNASTKRWCSVDRWKAGPFLTRMVLYALILDCRVSRLLSRADLGFPGLSWWAVCRKP